MSKETKQVTAGEVRAAFPQCIAVADEFRAAFGDGVKLTYLSEGGREMGAPSRKPDDHVVTAAQMVLEPLTEEPKPARRKYG